MSLLSCAKCKIQFQTATWNLSRNKAASAAATCSAEQPDTHAHRVGSIVMRPIFLLTLSPAVSAFLALTPRVLGLLQYMPVHCNSVASASKHSNCTRHCHSERSTRCSILMETGSAVKRVAIVGAGIGGLTLANALRCGGGGGLEEAGIEEVSVFEKFDSVKPGVGGGIQINSGAVVLARLGLGEAIKAAGNPVERILSRTVGGRVILDLDVSKMVRSDAAKESILVDAGTPMLFTIMRDRLMQILAGALPPGVLKTDREVAGIHQSPEGATLRFVDGSVTGPYDLVVGADGIKGAARAAVRGEKVSGAGTFSVDKKDNAIYSGIRIQFGVAPGGHRPRGCEKEVHQWFGGDTYGLSATYGGIEDKQFEMIAAVYHDGGSKYENAEWNTVSAKEACLERLNSREFPQEMKAVADASDRFFELGIYYRNPLEGWISSGERQVVLLGDAAHAMPPNLGQGANQAIQDAYCLAECLAKLNRGSYDGSLSGALQDYERRRKTETSQVLAKSVVVGAIETLGGGVGEFFRDNFFFGMWKTGAAERVFMDGAMPKV